MNPLKKSYLVLIALTGFSIAARAQYPTADTATEQSSRTDSYAAPAWEQYPYSNAVTSFVYAMSNAAGPNTIAVLRRNSLGGFDEVQRVGTGGTGTGPGTAVPVDPLGSQNALLVSDDDKLLFAVNAGSNEVSVLGIRAGIPQLIGVVPSGGTYPVSLAQRGDKLYVLNVGGAEANVSTFGIRRDGSLTPLPSLTRNLGVTVPYVDTQPQILLAPAQLQFSPDGQWLLMTVKNKDGVGSIDLFAVNRSGALAAQPIVNTSNDPVPFGFSFDRAGHLLVTEAAGGALSSYAINQNGTLRTITSSQKNRQNATCWIDSNGRYAFVTNTASNTLSTYRINSRGELELLNLSDVSAYVGKDFAPTDIKLSVDGRYAYVGNSGAGSVTSFRIQIDGSLSYVNQIHLFDPASGMQGLATWPTHW